MVLGDKTQRSFGPDSRRVDLLDPGALRRYGDLGVPGPFGYVASRCAPLAGAGADTVIAASVPSLLPSSAWHSRWSRRSTNFEAIWHARDEAVLEGLAAYAPSTLNLSPSTDHFSGRSWTLCRP